MAFESLGEKLQNIMKKLRGRGRLNESDVKEAMREVRMALLEADVGFKVVKEFVAAVTEKAIGHDILESLNPGQQVVKLVHEELIALMGSTESRLTFSSRPPTVYLLCGLQGAGKTTTAGKLAGLLRKQGKQPLLVACDIYRPAAIKQLEIVGKNFNIPVFQMGDKVSPVQIAAKSLQHAADNGNDVVILDTAGRLHIDDNLMEELQAVKKATTPQEILLVIDAMTGQDAVNVAASFDEKLGLDGVIVTKLDSDTRGGAVLSVKKVTGKPIKYVGMGEKLEDLEVFHPDRMAGRILGMGDVLSLIDKAQAAFDEKEAAAAAQKMMQGAFTLEDFLEQMQQMKKMGPLQDLLGMIPGLNQAQLKGAQIDENALKHTEAIIQSMNRKERHNPDILNGSRKRRIAAGCGRTVQDVNRLLKQFDEMRRMMKGMMSPQGKKKMKKMGNMGNFPF